MLREQGRHALCQRIEVVRGLRAEEVEKHGRHPTEHFAAPVERFNGVLKRGRLWIVHYALYLLVLALHTFAHGRLKVFELDAIERHSSVGRIIWLKKRVCVLHSHTSRLISFILPAKIRLYAPPTKSHGPCDGADSIYLVLFSRGGNSPTLRDYTHRLLGTRPTDRTRRDVWERKTGWLTGRSRCDCSSCQPSRFSQPYDQRFYSGHELFSNHSKTVSLKITTH